MTYWLLVTPKITPKNLFLTLGVHMHPLHSLATPMAEFSLQIESSKENGRFSNITHYRHFVLSVLSLRGLNKYTP